jgi:hypothetical protein
MPITTSEALFFCGGAVAGVLVAKNWDKIKEKAAPLREKLAPLIETAAQAAGDAYANAARHVGERIESVQDGVAAAKASRID